MEAREMTYDEVVGGLRLDEVRILGESIRAAIAPRLDDAPRVVAVSYQPGNGTRYDLVFAPIDAIGQLGHETIPTGLCDPNGAVREGWTVVSKVNGSTWSYPFDLSLGEYAHAGYVASHTSGALDFADGCAIAAIFRAIANVDLYDDPRR